MAAPEFPNCQDGFTMPLRRRPFRFGFRLLLAVGRWRFRLRFPSRTCRSWRVWIWLVVLGMPFGYVFSLPVIVYLLSRFDLNSGILEDLLELYYLPLIYVIEYWPWLEEALEWCVEILELLFGAT